MAINNSSIKDREFGKFVESPTRPGSPAIEVVGDFAGGLVAGTGYTTIDVTYPTTIQEVYTFKLLLATVQTITVDYTTSTKDILSKVTYS
jgi:hypothetical protein